MSLADSEAAFSQHCNKLVPDGTLTASLLQQGIKSLSSLAFAIGTPQVPATEEQFLEFATKVNNGVAMDFGTQAALRRLHFEASAIVMAELKSKATDTSGDGTRKLPVAEKTARLKDQEARLPGLRIRGELQPSFALVDMVAHIKESNCITWIPPSKCGKRDSEIQQALKEKPVTLSLEQQMVKLASSEEPVHVDTSTDLQLQWAFQRRGLAMDQCSLISNAEHEIWVQQLLGQLTRDPPAGFARVTTSQVIRADREIFTLMAQEIQGSLQPDATGKFPMEEKLKTLRTDPRVTMFLLPLPKGTVREVEKTTATSSSSATPKVAATPTRPTKRAKVSAKAKAMCPQEFKGLPQKDSSGQAICWAFNQKAGCKLEVNNGRCKKGVKADFFKEKRQKVDKKSADQSADTVSASSSPKVQFSTVSQPLHGTANAGTVFTQDGNETDCNQKFRGLSVGDLLFVEIYAGTARLSKVAKDSGFQVLPVDKTSSRATQMFIAHYDVTDPHEFAALLELLRTEHHRIAGVHLAPACGTASRAREKQLKSFVKRGFKVPGPLRSKDKPMGLDGLSGLDKVRTELANQVYSATAEIVKLCIELDILCSVENPQNSLFWVFPDVMAILSIFPGFHVVFDNCMHGGARKKSTGWWSNKAVFAELGLTCNNMHEHAPWNPVQVGQSLKFPTAEEAAYPFLLCKRVTAILLKYVTDSGATSHDSLQEQLPATHTTSHRWILDMLPRGKQLKPLVSEFASYKYFLVEPSIDPEQTAFFKAQLRGCRLVQRRLQWGCVRVGEHAGNKILLWEADGKTFELDIDSPLGEANIQREPMQAELCTLGIPRDPWDFLQRAIDVGHPRSLAVHLNEEVTDMLRRNFSGDQCELVKSRAEFLMKWTARSKELSVKELELHNNLEPHLRGVLSGKRLLLFGEMLDTLGYPDRVLVRDIINGFPLTGWMPKTGVFPPHMKRPAHSLESALKFAKGVNHSITRQVTASQDSELDDTVWSKTLEEADLGWVWFDDSGDLDGKMLAKRFGLRQGEKTRLIDDCSIGGFNGACGASEKMKVHAVDEMAAYVCWCLTNLSGTAMQQVVGKTYDLKNAYKQYGIRKSDRDLLRLVVWDPVTRSVRYMGANALPFGAIGSVCGFLRISLAIWFIGVVGLRLCWTSFFDDFTLLSKRVSSKSASIAAEGLFSLLGVQFATEGKKAVEWDTKVKTLGVRIDLAPEGAEGRCVDIGHTETRVEELLKSIQTFLDTKRMTSKDAERLRGRLQWFESFAYGRVAQQALRTISGVASATRRREKLNHVELKALLFLKDRVLTAPPTRVQSTSLNTWLVFSDGACEGDDVKLGTIGAVLIDPAGGVARFFSEKVPEFFMQELLNTSKHPIFELELLPVLCAAQLWASFLNHSQCVFYVDNEAAKGALLSGATSTVVGQQLVSDFVQTEMDCQIKVWFARVPSSSNLADKPSRLDETELHALGVIKDLVNWNLIRKLVEDLGSSSCKDEALKSEERSVLQQFVHPINSLLVAFPDQAPTSSAEATGEVSMTVDSPLSTCLASVHQLLSKSSPDYRSTFESVNMFEEYVMSLIGDGKSCCEKRRTVYETHGQDLAAKMQLIMQSIPDLNVEDCPTFVKTVKSVQTDLLAHSNALGEILKSVDLDAKAFGVDEQTMCTNKSDSWLYVS
eukprot:s3494_g7.t1